MLYVYKEGQLQRRFVDLVYDQSSNQSLEEAMTSLSAQLNLIRNTYPDIVTIWMTSDKCTNFNSYNQIPFIVAGNARNWSSNKRDVSTTIQG